MPLRQNIAIAFSIVTLGGAALKVHFTRGPMTNEKLWRKKKTIVVHTDVAPELVAKIVRWKLTDPRFTGTEEMPGGREFRATFRQDQRSPFLKIHVKVMPSPAGTAVSVQGFPEFFSQPRAIENCHAELQDFLAGVCSTKILNPA